MNPTQIKGLIQYKTGMTVADWALTTGYHKANVYRAINNGNIKTKIHNLIAKTCGKTVSEIWPDQPQESA